MKKGPSSSSSPKRKLGQHPTEHLQMLAKFRQRINLKDIVFCRDFQRWMSRYWKRHLTPAEFMVLDMVFDRTLGWGKQWEWIPLKHFVDGVYNEELVWSEGTGMSQSTVQRAIKSLCKRTILVRRGRHGKASQYAINMLWNPPERDYPDKKKKRVEVKNRYYKALLKSGAKLKVEVLAREVTIEDELEEE